VNCDHSAAEHAATQRLTFATWVLVVVTAVLVLVTAMLAEATWAEKQGHHEAPAATQHEPVVTHEVVQVGPAE
jgi:hypothetical protein